MKVLPNLALLLLFFFQGLSAQSNDAIDWDYEIDLLARELSERHPDLFFKTDSVRFYQEMKDLAEQAPGSSLFQMAVRLQQVLAGLGDAQTQINYHFLIDKGRILPFDCYWFNDGIYIRVTDKLYEALLGKELIAINQIPMEVVIDSLSTVLVDDNPSVLKNRIPRMLTWFQLLEYFGFTSGSELSLRVKGSSGEEEVVIGLPVELGEMISVLPDPVPLGWQDQKTFFRDQYLEEEQIYYIQYNRCWSREVEEDFGSGASALFMPSFKEFEKQVVPQLKKKKVDKLVFDLRFNSGGHALQGTEFIRKICNALSREQTEFFVLVGRTTCEEAIINAIDLMKRTEVVLVGEETSGRPNYYGDVKNFVLPESGLVVSYPTSYYSLLEEDLPALVPDIVTPMDFKQYMTGIDPAMEAVRKHPLP